MLTTFLIRKVQHYRLTAVVMIIRWHCRPGVQFQAEGTYNHMLPAIPYSYSLRLHILYPTFLFLHHNGIQGTQGVYPRRRCQGS